MHILGIYLVDGDKSVIKNLKPNTWYPMYDLENFKTVPNAFEYKEIENFYQLEKSDTTKISISCIVGENGSGKSTLLDILYRTINDFSWHIKNSNPNLPTSIYYAYGFHAKLFFEAFNKIGYIEIVANNFDKKHSKDCIKWNNKIQYFSQSQFDLDNLNDFFYTIVTNYSFYSFTPDDYKYEWQYFEKEESFYPIGIFNKNDAYITPIVLLPYRNDKGIILMDNEKVLATQRILALSIFLYKKYDTSLIDGKNPYRIKYSFNQNYSIDDNSYKKAKDIIDNISDKWKTFLKLDKFSLSDKQRKIIKLYLGYKTYKFLNHYGFFNKNYTNDEYQTQAVLKGFDYAHIEMILADKSFMTLKLRQTHSFLQKIANQEINIEKGELVVAKDFKAVDENTTIDDYFLQLPPPFYNFDLYFTDRTDSNKSEFSLNKMSSGEKQILFNLSYVLYHLKNLSTKSRSINATPEYKNAVLIFDEAELYMHPESQRQYIYKLISSIQKCHFESIKDIHVIFATHSPYLLSDVKSNNVLMLEGGNVRKNQFTTQTFSANVYDLLKNQFFMNSPVGEFARIKMQGIMERLESNRKIEKEDLLKIQEFIDVISDNYIRKTLNRLLTEYERKLRKER